jgi:hypothetical protein
MQKTARFEPTLTYDTDIDGFKVPGASGVPGRSRNTRGPIYWEAYHFRIYAYTQGIDIMSPKPPNMCIH